MSRKTKRRILRTATQHPEAVQKPPARLPAEMLLRELLQADRGNLIYSGKGLQQWGAVLDEAEVGGVSAARKNAVRAAQCLFMGWFLAGISLAVLLLLGPQLGRKWCQALIFTFVSGGALSLFSAAVLLVNALYVDKVYRLSMVFGGFMGGGGKKDAFGPDKSKAFGKDPERSTVTRGDYGSWCPTI